MEKLDSNPIYKIALEISNADTTVVSDINECVLHISDYYAKHRENYENRSIKENHDNAKLQWIGMVDSLLENEYICECDYKEELDEFIACVESLKGVIEQSLPIDSDWFDEEDEITDWCKIIDQKWKPFDMCIACIDIGSDCYDMFPCSQNKLDMLRKYAFEAGYRIDLACKL